MIGLVTDSNSMLPSSLVTRLGARVVPLTFTVDGVSIREDDTLDLSEFYAQLRSGAAIGTAAPSPGEFVSAYQELAAAGATEIVSIHVGSAFSGTVNAAQVAARMATVPVRIVDSGIASFALGCAVWAAADTLAAGGNATAAALAAVSVAPNTTSVFTVGEPDRARTGGRLRVGPSATGTPLVAMRGAGSEILGTATSIRDAVDQMVDYLAKRVTRPVRIGIGEADHPDAGDALAAALTSLDHVREIIPYRVGPTVAAHTGASTFGAVVWELDQ
jgi:DegV family protein with EDD domain